MSLETFTDSERGSSPWFYPKGNAFDEDYDEDREEVRVHISLFNVSLRFFDMVHVDLSSEEGWLHSKRFFGRRG